MAYFTVGRQFPPFAANNYSKRPGMEFCFADGRKNAASSKDGLHLSLHFFFLLLFRDISQI
jgi:hypothetical protein